MYINQAYKEAISEILPYIGKAWNYVTQDEYGGVHMFREKPVRAVDGFIFRKSGYIYPNRGVFLPLDIPLCSDWKKSKLLIVRNSKGVATGIKNA